MNNFREVLARMNFNLWQSLGLHVIPNHFYQPVPDTRCLSEDLWKRPSSLPGIDINEPEQLDLLSKLVGYKGEYDKFPLSKTDISYKYYINNGVFESIDAEILYSMIRYFKPSRMVEIGGGYSTYLSAQAVLKNRSEGNPCELVSIEPYPDMVLRSGFPGLDKLIPRRIQDVPISEFSQLGYNDILFIDSSHVLKIGSDVQYEYLEILPRLNPGVLVHVHDIFLPNEYPCDWVRSKHIFWTEQYILRAFLTFNMQFKILWAGNHMYSNHRDTLRRAFVVKKDDSWVGPDSFWIQRT